jgi:purine-binding chemotaxis protein CheW
LLNPIDQEAHDERLRTYVTFVLCGARLALPAGVSQYVVPLVQVNPVPGAPDLVYGVARLRGTSIPVLDIAARFGLPPAELKADSHLLIATAHGRDVALVCDGLPDILSVPVGSIAKSSEGLLPAGMERWAKYVVGSFAVREFTVPVLSLGALLEPDEKEQLEASLMAPEEAREGACGEVPEGAPEEAPEEAREGNEGGDT